MTMVTNQNKIATWNFASRLHANNEANHLSLCVQGVSAASTMGGWGK